ncbi:hypothetical protein J27TS7_10800 [Paenibacillus dendritiformis]|uniref:hypothetical protein n=1 Tax=Paenibacillus dendritiformis TaxID=130049 RepID=UPI001B03D404|nr:hypothetical protein [Paenibacillus dendritiformis]GIO71566.1 hypothetical protein J27TS7_10800 [Paenibacillus dendritiformis]
MAMEWAQGELFSKATDAEIQRAKFLLEKYIHMVALMRDFEAFEQELAQVAVDGETGRRIDQDDLHADKTANAVILTEKQKWVYEQYRFYTTMLRRAAGLIQDEDAKRAVEYRFFQGYSRKETILFFRRGLSDSTIDRRIEEGTTSIANTLKLLGFFERDEMKF